MALALTAFRLPGQALALTGIAGFGTAIGIHFPIGYTSFSHLLPAFIGATMFVTGMLLTFPANKTQALPEIVQN